MKMLAAAASGAAIAGFFVVMHADTPWFSPNTDEMFSVACSSTTLTAGQAVVIGTVPNGKKLVVTDAQVYEQTPWGSVDIDLSQVDSSGAAVVKVPRGLLTTYFAYPHSGIVHCEGMGVVFEPGTNLVLTLSPSAASPDTFSYFVAGYLTQK
jgi:hypothetical protein